GLVHHPHGKGHDSLFGEVLLPEGGVSAPFEPEGQFQFLEFGGVDHGDIPAPTRPRLHLRLAEAVRLPPALQPRPAPDGEYSGRRLSRRPDVEFRPTAPPGRAPLSR